MHHEIALQVALASIVAPGVVYALWLWGKRRARLSARREMLRRNKICRDWMQGSASDTSQGPVAP